MLLDVDMPFLDGMTAAGHIRRVDPEVVIVFVTNLAQYAIQGYSVNELFLLSRGRRGPFLDALADYVGGISG